MLSSSVFERLIAGIDGLQENLRPIMGGHIDTSSQAAVNEVVVYLFRSFERLKKEVKNLSSQDYDACADVIFVNARTSLQTPDVYLGQDPMDQFFQMVFNSFKKEKEDLALEFFSLVFEVSLMVMVFMYEKTMIRQGLVASFVCPSFALL